MTDPYHDAATRIFSTKHVSPEQRNLAKSVLFYQRYSRPMTNESHYSDSTIRSSTINSLESSRRRARRQQRWAIALCVIGSTILLTLAML